MKIWPIALAAACVPGVIAFAASLGEYAPGKRIVMHAHNAYPDHGKYADRIDRALSVGTPVMVELDPTWYKNPENGKSGWLLIHGVKNATGQDPSLENYALPKLRPIMEKALKDGNKESWPLVTLYLDFKSDPSEHAEAVYKLLDDCDSWLTFAKKPSDAAIQTPLEVGPLMIMVYDKDDTKRKLFYDRIPVGGKVRVFGSVQKPPVPAGMSKQEGTDWLSTLAPDRVLTSRADTYRRWFFMEWNFIEKGGQSKAADWTRDEEERLRKFVDSAHRLGYFVSSFCLNGHSEAEGDGLDKSYNFGSREAVLPRWNASIRAHMDFIQTDHYEDLVKLIRQTK